MDIKIIRKADDEVLRASIGGAPDTGFYLVYRGDPRDIIQMLSLVQANLIGDLLENIHHPIEPEDAS